MRYARIIVGTCEALDRDLELAIVEALEQFDLLQRLGDERLRSVTPCQLLQVLRATSRHWRRSASQMPAALAAFTTCSTPVRAADVAWVDAHGRARPASIARRASDALKWMSAITGIGEKRTISGQGLGVLDLRHGDACDLAACRGKRRDLRRRRPSTSCVFVRVIDCTTTGAPPPISDVADADLDLAGHSPSQRSPGRWSVELPDVVREPDEEQEKTPAPARPSETRSQTSRFRNRPRAPSISENRMWPPSSGSSGKQVQERERQRDEPEHPEVVLRRLRSTASDDARVIPIGLATLVAALRR